MSQSNSESVKKYRAKLATDGCARMEVTLGAWLITKARVRARRSRRPLWNVVEEALIAHLKADPAAETGNGK